MFSGIQLVKEEITETAVHEVRIGGKVLRCLGDSQKLGHEGNGYMPMV